MTTDAEPRWVVAVGASAGGLDPIRRLLASLPVDLQAAVVIAQHVSPDHDSLLTDLLQRSTQLEVVTATDDAPLVSGRVLVVPPGRHATFDNGRLRLEETGDAIGPKPCVTMLYRSLAEDFEDRGVAITLSGSGSDGAIGMMAVRSAGGVTVVQDPQEADYDGMPESAIRFGAVDRALPVHEIASYLADLVTVDRRRPLESIDDVLGDLGRMTRNIAGVDLARFRTSVQRRRVARRMAVLGLQDPAAYLRHSQANVKEITELVADLSVNVTEFFRDREHFDALRSQLVSRAEHIGGKLRVWSAGCATGEEAYSLAMMIDALGDEGVLRTGYQILATDLSAQAIRAARAGVFPADAGKGIPKPFREKYLLDRDGELKVLPRLRENLLFSINDLGQDPPFSNIDVAVCRNVLIYLSTDAQQQCLESLHYSLKTGGILFLGPADSVEPAADRFAAIDSSAGLYVALGPKRALTVGVKSRNTRGVDRRSTDTSEELLALRRMRPVYASAVAVISATNQLLWTGGNVGEWLTVGEGLPTLDLLALARKEHAHALRGTLSQHRRTLATDPAAGPTTVVLGEQDGRHALAVIDQHDSRRPGTLRVDFIWRTARTGSSPEMADQDEDLLASLESELKVTRASLHATVDELDHAYQDLLGVNEELQTTNEEFQATNEELQSTNEELLTLNQELTSRGQDLRVAARHLEIVLGASNVQMVLVDHRLQIMLASLGFGAIAGRPVHEGDRFSDLASSLRNPKILADLIETLDDGNVRIDTWTREGHRRRYEIARVESGYEQPAALLTVADVSQIDRWPAQDGDVDLAHLTGDVLARPEVAVIHSTGPEAPVQLNDVAVSMLGRSEVGADTALVVGEDGTTYTVADIRRLVAERQQPLRLDSVGVDQSADDSQAHTLIAIGMPEGDGVIITLQDDEAARRAGRELRWAASHDSLTNLLNRNEFTTRLDRLLHDRRGDPALIFIDIDGLKPVNDLEGHAAGDRLLIAVAEILSEQIRDGDCVGRLGGDEFAIALAGTNNDVALVRAEEIRRRIEALRVPAGDQQTVRVTASIGVTTGRAGDAVDVILARADTASIEAKRDGKNRVVVAGAADDRVARRLSVARVTRMLLSDDPPLRARFDRIVTMDHAAERRYELLAGLHDGDNLAPAGEFIKDAERAGLVNIIDRWALETAVQILTDRPASDVRLHVNVCPMSLVSSSYGETLRELLTDDIARRLAFEVTESSTIVGVERCEPVFQFIRARGAELYLDDLGHGFNSLNNLRSQRYDGIKLDGAIVSSILDSPVSAAITGGVIAMATELDLLLVAESVENADVEAALREMGVRHGQGELYGRELTIDDVLAELDVSPGSR